MRTLTALLLLLSAIARTAEPVDPAIRKTIAAFNQTARRASVLAPNADLGDLDRYRQQEVSQMYFEVRSVHWMAPDMAIAEATGTQYGSLIGRRSVPAAFVLVRSRGEWKISRLMLGRSGYSGLRL